MTPGQVAAILFFVFGVNVHHFFFVFYLVQRRLGNKEMSILDEFRHIAEKES